MGVSRVALGGQSIMLKEGHLSSMKVVMVLMKAWR